MAATKTEQGVPLEGNYSDTLPEKQVSSKEDSLDESTVVDYDEKSQKRLRRRLDVRVVPPLFALFFVSFLDRGNIGNARIQGLEESLNMQGQDYAIALFIFFIPYILFEVPSNILLKRLNPNVWLSFIVTMWGCATIGQGLVRNHAGLVGLRAVLGIFEAGLFPGGSFVLSRYYARTEMQWRFSLFVSSTTIAGAFGGLFAYALAKMDGLGGYEGWRWIFIMEGILTVIIGLLAFVWVPNWPEKVRWLSSTEKSMIARKLDIDAGGGAARMDRLNKKSAMRIAKDWKIYVGIIIHIGCTNSAYSMAFFLPTVINQMGYSAEQAQLYVIPVYLVATVVTLSAAVLTDRYNSRYIVTMVALTVGMVGYAVLLAGTSIPVRGSLAWCNFQVSGHYKRAVTAAMIIGFGNTGGFVGSNVWLAREAPTFRTGVAVCLGLFFMSAIFSTIYYLGLRAENARRDRGERDYRYTEEADELDNMGDDHPTWRYIL
ncbi:hypothetical protein B0A52_01261 [Exophiala mesophila]|uniref:Major facilitator superfamily (MFS) profile domain-containing protein n=1 Tax=Exophiala mesophila TaxID=212818 RepID=A0A438NGX3_EXOME|nr:hypothetical protein B0A52_01261 [Exophiala mesophila]